MKEIWAFALDNPALLFVPAIGFVLSSVLLRIRKRYVNEGVLFGHSPCLQRDGRASNAEEEMAAESHIDLAVALQKIHELALMDENSGAYWREIGQLLQRANRMQADMHSLRKELERCHAMLPKTD